MDLEPPDVVHNARLGRFEITQGHNVAVLEYALSGETITFVHTGVPSELEGRGLGSRLVRAGLEHARRERLRVVPQCPFVRRYMQRHVQYRDLLARRARK